LLEIKLIATVIRLYLPEFVVAAVVVLVVFLLGTATGPALTLLLVVLVDPVVEDGSGCPVKPDVLFWFSIFFFTRLRKQQKRRMKTIKFI
jgi:hypothetical protein